MKKHDVGMSFRVPANLRDAAAKKAEERGERLSDVMRDALKRYVAKKS